MPLTLRQEEFITAYVSVASGNGTEAARLAGYRGSDASLAQIASRLLNNVNIRTRLEEHRKALGITRERILTGLLRVAEDDRPNNGIAAVKAYQLLGTDMHGMFKPAERDRDTDIRIVVVREQIAQPDRLMIATNTTTSNRTNQTDNTIENQEEENNNNKEKEKEKEEDR